MCCSGDTARLDGGEEIIAILVRLDHFILASPTQLPLAPLLNPIKGKPVLIVEANLNASIRLLVVTPRGKHGHVLAPVPERAASAAQVILMFLATIPWIRLWRHAHSRTARLINGSSQPNGNLRLLLPGHH